MLVLSRKVGETIEIGSNVTLVVTRVAGGRIQIGIDAPLEVSVRRGEISKVTTPQVSVPRRGENRMHPRF